MASLLRRGLDYLSPTSTPAPSSPTTTIPPPEIDERENKQRSAEFVTATTSTTLFRPVDPEIDGDDCDRDCASCTIKYPAKFNVDYEDELYGHVKGWATHVLVATGKTDWVRDVADEKGSVMEAIDRGGVNASNGVWFLSDI